MRDGFPVKADGFRYDAAGFLRCWREVRGFDTPDAADYTASLPEFDVIRRINAGEIDEVWLFGPPYAGYYESPMAGPGAFWCNSPPLTAPVRHAARLPAPLRGDGLQLRARRGRDAGELRPPRRVDHGPRLRRAPAAGQPLGALHPLRPVAPGQAALGNVHFAPNSERDYDWGNPRPSPASATTG